MKSKVVATILLVLLAVQTASQPVMLRIFIPATAIPSACILLSEVVKVIVGGSVYFLLTRGTGKRTWTLVSSIRTAGPPAIIYSIQNIAITSAQRNLSGLLYNVLNQSKLLSAAIMGYFILGKIQSSRQVLALIGLSIASVLAVSSAGGDSGNGAVTSTIGDAGALLASSLSGLSGSLSDLAMQRQRRDAFLFSCELSVFVIIAMVCGFISDAALRGPDSDIFRIVSAGGFIKAAGIDGPLSLALIPVLSGAFGGIIVGQVAKRLGSIRKGLAVSTGVVLTAFLDSSVLDTALLIAIPLALISVTIHALESEKVKSS